MSAGTGLLIVLSAAWLGWGHQATAAPIVASFLNPTWTDADKLNDQGDWGFNYWDDVNDNGRWDKTEPMGDQPDSTWSKPKYAKDLSCWIASASNMLASAGFGAGNAQNIYWDMIYNMQTSWHAGGWQFGGWQHEALNWYLDNRQHPMSGLYEVDYYGVYDTTRDGSTPDACPVNPFDYAANLLASDYEVGIVIHGSIYHAVTFQGYDDALGRIDITDSDQDAYQNALGLDPYFFTRTGPTQWFITDYVSSGIAVDYFATLRFIPEPGDLSLMFIGLAALGATRSSKLARAKL